MTKIWSGVVAASFVATVGLSAQQAPPTTSPASPGGAAQQPAPPPGCERAEYRQFDLWLGDWVVLPAP